jgi:hypothetical protein
VTCDSRPRRGHPEDDSAKARERRGRLVPLPEPSGPRRIGSTWPLKATETRVGLGFLGIVGTATVAESTSEAVRQWSVGHPITVCLTTGLVLFLGTVYGFDRIVARRESNRWLEPGREALNTWLFSVDSAVEEITNRISQAQDALKERSGCDASGAALFATLARQQPTELRAIADVAWEHMRSLGLVTSSVAATTSRSPDLAGQTALMFDAQRKLDDLATATRHQAVLLHPLLGDDGPAAARAQNDEISAYTFELIHSIADDAQHMRLWVLETRDAAR